MWVEAHGRSTRVVIAEHQDGRWAWFTNYEWREFLAGDWVPRWTARWDRQKEKAVFRKLRR
jgi:hypothetical protein